MSEYKVHHTRPSILSQIHSNQRVYAQRAMAHHSLRQVAKKRAVKTYMQTQFNPMAAKKSFKTLEHRKTIRRERAAQAERTRQEQKNIVTREMSDAADFFNKRNPELQQQTLLILRGLLKEGDTHEEILQKVLDFYGDFTLADEALDFLLGTTHGELRDAVAQAKEELNARFQREIIAGRNIAAEARSFSEQGLGSPTALRDMYRDITGNPREVHTLFEELSRLFDYEKMKNATNFLFHSLGADMKAKGPSISRAELVRLMEDTRTLQAILGVYLFFKERMKLIYSQFTNLDLPYPDGLTFEILAKRFMQLVKERYLSSERVKQLARQMGISEEALAQIIIFSQMRDAIRQVSPRVYRDNKHKEEALAALIEALEELEEAADEEEE